MTLDITAQVRLRIQDRWRYAVEEFTGNGYDATFKLAQGSPYSTLISGSATIRLATSYSSTGATFDNTLGLLTFSGTISANSAFRAAYHWAVFSNDEVADFIQQGGGSVVGASLEAVRALMFDGLRRARWAAPDGSTYDDTAALKHLNDLYDRMLAEQGDTPVGGITSWAEQQQYYEGGEYPAT